MFNLISTSLKKSYYYLFYKFYKLAKASPSIFPSDFVAVFTICGLEVLFLISMKLYSGLLFKQNDEIDFISLQTMIPLAIICIVKYYFFLRNDNWKKKVKQFDKLPAKKNLTGSWIVFGIVVFIIVNLIISFYLLAKKNGIY